MVALNRSDVDYWRANAGRSLPGAIIRAMEEAVAALPVPIVWETHLGVEMARCGERVAIRMYGQRYRCQSDEDMASFSNNLAGYFSKDDAEQWLRGGAE